jgi:hypothetical protein
MRVNWKGPTPSSHSSTIGYSAKNFQILLAKRKERNSDDLIKNKWQKGEAAH